MQQNPALPSNAGDRYHFVYVARKLLDLLYPRTTLVRVEVEGVAEEDSSGETAAKLLGVDLTEYFGGDLAASASRVELVQVKYSPTNPDEAWTIARLIKRTSNNPRSSVIGRLAEAYETMVPLVGAATQLWAKFVSNQPLDPDLRDQLKQLQEATASLDLATAVERIRDDSSFAFITPLQQASHLDWPAFVSFLRVLDLRELGASSLTTAETNLFKGLDQLTNQADILVGHLISDVQRAATPGQQRTFRKQEVYAQLRLFEGAFLPAPAKLESSEKLFHTDDVRRVAEAIHRQDTGTLIVHGVGGTGKTSTLQVLARDYTSTIAFVLYDCFAGGEGLQAGRERFPAKKLFTQLTNELDALLHTNVLATTKLDRDRLIGVFLKGAEEAAKIAAAEGRRLVIAVDAADNAARQARRSSIPGEESFVPLLARLALPRNCVLLVTTRTENLADLGLSGEECRLNGFTPDETQRHAHELAPAVSRAFAKKLHERTSGNPRVQAAILRSVTQADANDQDALLEQRARATIFEYFSDAFPDRISGPNDRLAVAVLFEATQPVDIATVAAILTRPVDEIRVLVQSLAFGLDLLPDQTVKWRDQDFWDFAHDELASERYGAKSLLAHYCLDHFEASPYARANVSRHVFEASLLDELVDFWLSGVRLDQRIRDAAPHNEGVLRDVSYALRAAVTRQRRVEVLRLLNYAADLAQGRTVFVSALADFPDVAVAQNFVESYLEALHAEPQEEDVARRYIALAAAMADANHDFPAAEELRLRGVAILRQRDRFNRERRFDLRDVENLAVYDTAVQGLTAALQNLQAWRPPAAVYPVYATTMRRAARQGLAVDAALKAAKLRGAARSYAALGALTVADQIEPAQRGKLATSVAKYFVKPAGEDLRPSQRFIGQAVEALMRAGDLNAARILLPRWAPREPFGPRDPDLRDFLRRTACDEVLNDQVFDPATFKRARDRQEEEKSTPTGYRPHDAERDELRSEMRLAYPALLCRARAWATKADTILSDVRAKLPQWEERHWSSPPRIVANAVVADFLEATLSSPSRDRDLVLQILQLSEKELPVSTRNIVRSAELLGADARYLRECEDLIRAGLNVCRPPAIGARDAVDRLLSLHRIARRFDASLATELFNTARLLAAGIDATIDHRVLALLDTADSAMPSGSVDADDLLRLAAVVEYGQQMDEESPESRMDRVLQLLGRHDCGLAVSAARIWDEDDLLDIRSGLMAVAKGAAYRADVPDALLGSMVEMAKGDDAAVALFEAIVERRGASAHEVVLPLWSDFALRQRGTGRIEHGERFLAACSAFCVVTESIVTPVRTFLDAASAAGVHVPDQRRESIGLADDSDQPPQPTFLSSVQDMLAQSPARGLVALQEASDKQLRTLTSTEASQIFSAVAGHLPSSSIVALLAAVDRWNSVSYATVDVFVVLRAVAKAASGGSAAAVREAARRHLTTDSLRQLPHYFRADAYPACRGCWSGQEASFFDTVAMGIASELRAFDPGTLQLWIGRLAKELPPADAAALLRHILPRTFKEIPNPRELKKPAHSRSNQALVHALCDCLGHPRREVRWHAVHAIVTLVGLLGSEIAPLLMAELSDSSHPRWMTRREWLLFTFEHIAYRWPELLAQSLRDIAACALDPDCPHAKIRNHARATCLRVSAKYPEALDAATRTALQKVNQPIGVVKEKKATAGLRRWSGRDDRPFYIDETDTVPYWYDRVADCFNLSSKAFTERAYGWIVDRWGITDDLCREEVKKKRWDWRQTSNDHGSEPSIETLEKYAERHAMFMVAGELIDSKPVARRDHSDDETWTDWCRYTLRGADPSLPGRLLVPPPLDFPDNYGIFPKDFESWRSERLDKDFRHEVVPPGDPERVVVLGHREVRSADRDLTVRVHSAFVSRETARALVRAIENHGDVYAPPYDEVSYAIIVPELEDEMRRAEKYKDHDEEQVRGRFSLRRFVVYAHQELPLQGGDPRWRDWARDYRIPSRWVMEQLQIARPDLLRLAWKRGNVVVAESELWYDGEDSEYPTHHAEGNRLLIRRDEIAQLMAQTSCDVIVTVTIQRQRSYDYRSRGNDEYDRGQTRAYLLSDLLQ
jgi:hypothetical protein